ncbi:MAG: hypothetical protein FWC40_06280 [Proteobacteria bacterium]|nr:hypothetical protein [Pseudomonadota bacterium]
MSLKHAKVVSTSPSMGNNVFLRLSAVAVPVRRVETARLVIPPPASANVAQQGNCARASKSATTAVSAHAQVMHLCFVAIHFASIQTAMQGSVELVRTALLRGERALQVRYVRMAVARALLVLVWYVAASASTPRRAL